MGKDRDARRKEIRRELRTIARRPDAPGAATRIAELRGEYRRLLSADRTPDPASARPVAPPSGLSEQDAAAVRTWPPELRARLLDGALSRTILPWGRD